MAQNKNVPNGGSVAAFLSRAEPAGRREDALALCTMMTEITGEDPVMWGPGLVGFGRYHYVYDSGREGDFFKVGFAPRKANLVVYVVPGFDQEGYAALLDRLGRHRTGKSCLYLGRLASVDEGALRELIASSWRDMTERYG